MAWWRERSKAGRRSRPRSSTPPRLPDWSAPLAGQLRRRQARHRRLVSRGRGRRREIRRPLECHLALGAHADRDEPETAATGRLRRVRSGQCLAAGGLARAAGLPGDWAGLPGLWQPRRGAGAERDRGRSAHRRAMDRSRRSIAPWPDSCRGAAACRLRRRTLTKGRSLQFHLETVGRTRDSEEFRVNSHRLAQFARALDDENSGAS